MFDGERGSKLHTVHLVEIIHEKQGNVDFCGLILKQAQTRPPVVPERTQTARMYIIFCSGLQYV